MISYVALKQFRFQKQSEKKLFTGLFLLRGEKKGTKKKKILPERENTHLYALNLSPSRERREI